MPGSGFVLKLNTEFGLITSPDPQGVPIFQRYFLGGILDVRGFYLRSIGPRLPLTPIARPELAAHRQRRQHRRQPRGLREPRARVPDPRQGRHPRRRLLRRRQLVEHRKPVLQDHAGSAVRQGRVSPCFIVLEQPRVPADVAPASASAGSRRSARCASSGVSRSRRCRTRTAATSSSRSGTSSEVWLGRPLRRPVSHEAVEASTS